MEKKIEKEAFKQVNLQHSPKALTRLLLQVHMSVNVNKFCLEYYPHLFPDSLEHKDKRKLMKRFLFCRYSFISFACTECFGQLKFFLGQLDCKALLPEGQPT